MGLSNVEIVSDGLPRNTHIFVDGVEIKGVIGLEIGSESLKSPIKATITIIGPKIKMRCKGKFINDGADRDNADA